MAQDSAAALVRSRWWIPSGTLASWPATAGRAKNPQKLRGLVGNSSTPRALTRSVAATKSHSVGLLEAWEGESEMEFRRLKGSQEAQTPCAARPSGADR